MELSEKHKIDTKSETSTEVSIDQKDLDSYNHLNNSNYAKYFELGRKNLMREHYGIDDSSLIERGIGLWVENSNYEFKVPAQSKPTNIHSHISNITGCRVLSFHKMEQDGQILATAGISQFFIDLRTNKPIKLTDKRLEDLLNKQY